MSVPRLLVPLALCALLSGIAPEARAQGDAGFRWQVSTFAEQGTPTAFLAYAVPETDNALFHFRCAVGQGEAIRADLFIDVGATAPGGPTDATIRVGDAFETRPATIVAGAFGPQVRLALDPADRLWDLLKAGSTGQVAARGGDWAGFHLDGSNAAISEFLRHCVAITQTIETGGTRTVVYSTRGLTAAMDWIDGLQGRAMPPGRRQAGGSGPLSRVWAVAT
ncbi:MAG: hypothetical protein GVY13_11560 [Alphaproteobacteria bacterium]|nr:hypothetical protein [Alphaproteobacteria bacterium]